MSTISDSEILSTEHYEFLQLNQVGRLSSRVAMTVDAEERSLREFNAELLQRIGDYRKKNLELSSIENELRAELSSQVKQATDRERELTFKYKAEVAELKKSLAEAQIAKLEESEHALSREAQLSSAYEALRTEYSKIDQCYASANESILKLQLEIREREIRTNSELQELTNYLTSKANGDSQTIRDENLKLRDLLSVRDARNDNERASLHAYREQLTGADAQLKSTAEKIKRAKLELIRLTRSADDEIRFSFRNPFTDYLEMADLEVSQVELHLAATSNLSPLKAKLEARLKSSLSHRDGIRAILERSNTQLATHSKSIQTLLKTLEFLT